MKVVCSLKGFVCSFAVLLLSLGASAQTQPEQLKQLREMNAPVREMNAPEEIRTFFLNNVTQTQDALDILTDLRNELPHAHAHYVQGEGALTVRATVDDMAQAEKLISELDRKRKVYKIAYSIVETDGGKPAGTQHVELILPTGSKTTV